MRIEDGGRLTYPAWVHRDVDRSLFVVHDAGDRTFQACLDEGECADHRSTGCAGGGVADARVHRHRGRTQRSEPGHGRRYCRSRTRLVAEGELQRPPRSCLAGAMPSYLGSTPRAPGFWTCRSLGFRAARAHRQLVEDTGALVVQPPADLRPVLRTNARPAGPRHLRTLERRRSDLSGPTVTIAALSAVSVGLAEHLRSLGEDPSYLGAEVPMAKPPPRLAYNHFGNVGVGLHPELAEPPTPLERIAANLDARRRRAAHPAIRMADLAFAATPAPFLRWGMDQFDPDVRVSKVTGNAVVSSVNCGAERIPFRWCTGDCGMRVSRSAADDGVDARRVWRRRHDLRERARSRVGGRRYRCLRRTIGSGALTLSFAEIHTGAVGPSACG